MDDVFWASVVKRWSEASESVIELRQEIAILREERALHQCTATTPTQTRPHLEYLCNSTVPSKQPSETNSKGRDSDAADSVSTIRDELQGAEIGLRKAKEEYHKLQNDLIASSKTINELKSENQKLIHDHNLEIARIRAEYQRTITPRRLRKLDHLATSMELQESMQQPLSSITTSTAQAAPKINQQINSLTQSLKTCEADKEEIRHQLMVAQDKLHKAEETIKILLASVVKLQAIARLPQSYSNSIRRVSDASLYSASRKSSKLSFASSLHSPQHAATSNSVSEISHTKPTTQPSYTLSHIHENPIKGNYSVTKSLLPPNRRRVISELPAEIITATTNESDNKFDRAFLKYILGEGVHSLIEHFPTNHDILAEKKSIASSYLCPTQDHHPWAPSAPGQHGFLFAGFGKENDYYAAPAIRNLFIGLPKTHRTRRVFRYLGKYRITQVEPLTYDEWTTLSDEIQVMYVDQSLDTENGQRHADHFLLGYDGERLRIACVQLQCIGFDQQLYEALISYRASEPKWVATKD